MDAERLFDVALPELAERQPSAFGATRGSISIWVGRGPGWTVQLGDVENPVQAGVDLEADLALKFEPWAFEEFLSGELDVDAAVQKSAVQFDGKLDLLESFGFLLMAARGQASLKGLGT